MRANHRRVLQHECQSGGAVVGVSKEAEVVPSYHFGTVTESLPDEALKSDYIRLYLQHRSNGTAHSPGQRTSACCGLRPNIRTPCARVDVGEKELYV